MKFQTLKRGDMGEDVIFLQTQLNKVGSMLVADGDFGPGTEKGALYAQDIAQQPATGIANSVLWEWLDTQAEPFQYLHTNGVAFIAKEETGGLSYYHMVTRWPHYPGHSSGITIGVGYDLRFNTENDFKETWGNYLPGTYIDELTNDIGKKGSKSRSQELKSKGIEVPFKSAWPVLIEHTLPRFYRNTESIYPSLSNLPNLCRSVLVSIVFNRGASLSGSRRKEMKEIQNILKLADNKNLSKEKVKELLKGVEEQILSMKRLWSPESGLIKRRQAEANLWRKGLASW
ncbi:peptidoglycan-binding protein [Desulfococcaceae bacterium HSG8]|nr:peptidoglycan-binding protein [Desulfococcaceae bacterium HSG8]